VHWATQYNERQWPVIAAHMGPRFTTAACYQRYFRVLKRSGCSREPFGMQDRVRLLIAVLMVGETKWALIARHYMFPRTDSQLHAQYVRIMKEKRDPEVVRIREMVLRYPWQTAIDMLTQYLWDTYGERVDFCEDPDRTPDAEAIAHAHEKRIRPPPWNASSSSSSSSSSSDAVSSKVERPLPRTPPRLNSTSLHSSAAGYGIAFSPQTKVILGTPGSSSAFRSPQSISTMSSSFSAWSSGATHYPYSTPLAMLEQEQKKYAEVPTGKIGAKRFRPEFDEEDDELEKEEEEEELWTAI
jgi:hypothetical protein